MLLTISICFLAALAEGADIVSMGLAAPSVAREFGFQPEQMSYVLTAAIVGLMAGAAIGGRLGDRVGRKRVLTGSFLLLAAFSLATAYASDLTQFILVRLLCGLGLGAAFPNLIALAAEASPLARRATNVGLMFCGQPIGATLLALFVASQAGAVEWQTIFNVGAVAPLMLSPLLLFALPESAAFRQAAIGRAPRAPIAVALFGEGRAPVTLLLWTSYAFSQVVVYLINNWLPTLMVAKGFTPAQASLISAFQNMGAAGGCVLLAVLADRGGLKAVITVGYLSVALGLAALGAAQGYWPVAASALVIGFFAIGGQLVLYTLAPAHYPTLSRATGVGAAISFGRLGGISGPLAAGKLMALGLAPAGVLLAATPCALIAGAAALAVAFRPRPSDS